MPAKDLVAAACIGAVLALIIASLTFPLIFG
jgi:hypothetical protein